MQGRAQVTDGTLVSSDRNYCYITILQFSESLHKRREGNFVNSW
jgi:hypothetical protein